MQAWQPLLRKAVSGISLVIGVRCQLYIRMLKGPPRVDPARTLAHEQRTALQRAVDGAEAIVV